MSAADNKALAQRYWDLWNTGNLMDDKIVESWRSWDRLPLLQQLGVVPTTG
jgi:hypothetical protein